MVFSLGMAILGLNDDSKINKVSMALLMMIFPIDGKPPIMFQYVDFLVARIKDQFITIIQLNFFRYQSYLFVLFISVHNDDFRHISLH